MSMQTWARRIALTLGSTALAAGAVAMPASAASAAPASQTAMVTAATGDGGDGSSCYKKYWDGEWRWYCSDDHGHGHKKHYEYHWSR